MRRILAGVAARRAPDRAVGGRRFTERQIRRDPHHARKRVSGRR
ncbi:MAG TPA: hypothetical protein VKA57_11725 [Solirubrobacteraceae bacterium]|nr:hypothetical protein [Solirubrobacteraceae bacterium]